MLLLGEGRESVRGEALMLVCDPCKIGTGKTTWVKHDVSRVTQIVQSCQSWQMNCVNYEYRNSVKGKSNKLYESARHSEILLHWLDFQNVCLCNDMDCVLI